MNRIYRPDTAFQTPRQRRPRVEAPKHLEFIRTLPCLVCGTPDQTEAAHIRMSHAAAAKRETGKAEKPSDCWTVPLCGDCHRFQHEISEAGFWQEACLRPYGANGPFVVAAFLFSASGDYERGVQIIRANNGPPIDRETGQDL